MSASNETAEACRIDLDRLIAQTMLASAECHTVLPSTQDRAREIVSESLAPLPCLVLADAQERGRGRGEHRWWTGPASLAFSLVLPAGDEIPAPQLSVAVALWIIDAVQPLAGDHPVRLRWPNDVYVDGRKLAGVLVEKLATGQTILGVGLNSNSTMRDAPPELLAKVTTLADLVGKRCSHEDLLIDWLERVQNGLAELSKRPVLDHDRLSRLCQQTGRLVETTTSAAGRSAPLRGHCLGITSDGGLLLHTSTGEIVTLHSGSVREVVPNELSA